MRLTAFALPLLGLFAVLTLAACQERTPQAQGRDCARAAGLYLPESWGPRSTAVEGADWTDLTVRIAGQGQSVSAHCTFQITKFGAALREMTIEGVSPWPAQMFNPRTRLWLTEPERQAAIRSRLTPRPGQYEGQAWEANWGPFGAGLRLSGRCWRMPAKDPASGLTLHACGAEQGLRYFVFGKQGVWIELPALPAGVADPGPNKMEDGAPAPPARIRAWGPGEGTPDNPAPEELEGTAP